MIREFSTTSIFPSSTTVFADLHFAPRGGKGRLACISPHLTSEARDKTAMTSLRWLAVLDGERP